MGELIIPKAFQTARPSQVFTAVPQNDSLADGIGQSYGVIGYTGKIWSLRYRGERKDFLRYDGTPAASIDVVIVGQARTKSKSYFPNYNERAAAGERPLCSSMDSIVPDADAQQKQAATCALCPRNEWKKQPNGRDGRECTDYKRLAVLLMPNQTAALFGAPILEPVFLRVPPASLQALALMGETMEKRGWHYTTFVTRITFANKPHPEMIFEPLQGLEDAEAQVVVKFVTDPLVERITGGHRGAVPATTGLAAPVTNVIQQSPQTPTPTQDTGFSQSAGALPVTPVQQTEVLPPTTATPASSLNGSQPLPQGSAPSMPVATGFGVAPVATPMAQSAPPQASPPSSPTSDTGTPSESDAELDARIANLINTSKLA